MRGLGSSEEPIMIKPIADNLGNEKCQAPSDVTDLVRCGFKSGCVSGRCKCFRQKTCRTELFACDMCENEDPYTPADSDADDID